MAGICNTWAICSHLNIHVTLLCFHWCKNLLSSLPFILYNMHSEHSVKRISCIPTFIFLLMKSWHKIQPTHTIVWRLKLFKPQKMFWNETSCYYCYYYIDGGSYLNLSKPIQSTTGLKVLKPAANVIKTWKVSTKITGRHYFLHLQLHQV